MRGPTIVFGTRTQHPVGQGFFHSAKIKKTDGTFFKYVVDCGALAKYEASRRKCISRYLRAHRGGRELDVLFITHFHADHVNGLIQLLDLKKGMKVDTIVMPYINVEDRLMCLAQTAFEDRLSAESSFYEEFIVNPSSALSRFEPSRVLFVGRGEGGAPGEIDTPSEGLDAGGSSEIGRGGRLISAPQQRTAATDSDRSSDQTEQGVIPHTSAIAVDSIATQWLLAPYVDPTVNSDRTKFLTALAKERKMGVAKLKQWLEDSSNVESLVRYGKDDLVAAYNAVGTDLNVTSLCIYSGPTNLVKGLLYRAAPSRCQTWHWRVGWLGTGDAALKSPTRRRDFLKHFRSLIRHVGTFTLPHHGSDHNFDEELIKKIRPDLCVAAADRYGNWRHPGSHTVQTVYSQGSTLQVVTSSDSSQLEEEIWRF